MVNDCTNERRFRTAALILTSFLLAVWALPLHAGDLPEPAERALMDAEWQQALESLNDVNLIEADVPCRLVAAHGCLATNRNNKALLLLLTVKPENVEEWSSWTEKLAEDNRSSAVACYLRGDALARSGKLDEADRSFTRAIERDPRFGLALVGRGVVRTIAGREDEAYIDFINATEVQPELAETHASLGCAEIAMRNASGALDAFNEALKLNSDFALAYNGRGCAHYGLGHPDEAAEDFEKAENLFPALAPAATTNGAFVMAMVSQKVDQNMGTDSEAGTTLTTRSQRLAPESTPDLGSMGPGEYRQFVDNVGIDRALDIVRAQKHDLLDRINQAPRSIEGHRGKIALYSNAKYLPLIKAVVDAATMRGDLAAKQLGTKFVSKGMMGAANQTLFGLGKEIMSKTAEPLPGGARRVAQGGIASIGLGKLDPGSALFYAAEEIALHKMGTHSGAALDLGTQAYRRAIEYGVLDKLDGKLVEQRIVRDMSRQTRGLPPIGRQADRQLGEAVMASGLPWRQMPDLARDLQDKIKGGAPVAIIGKTVQAHGIKQMLDNKGIPTQTWPSMDAAKLAALAESTRPSAIVGFKPKGAEALPDPAIGRKFPGGLPPGGGGGGARDITRDLVAYTLATDPNRKFFPPPGAAGGAIPLGKTTPAFGQGPPNPPHKMSVPAGKAGSTAGSTGMPLNWQNWVPKGDAGGVDSNMDWVFVDKGNWPVATFFTLGYESPSGDSAKLGGRK